ncbi:MAG: winged helix-turn-helix domain-containing protein [Kangiellaceae bacterium]|nr:winged helix-turn-helix domain-containing protein [Kangiellaceae bacterium]
MTYMPLYHFDSFCFNANSGELRSPDKCIVLRRKVAQLLFFFLQNPNRVLSKEQIFTQIWEDNEVVENTLNQIIKELRAHLSDSVRYPKYIKTFPRRGYSWIFTDIKEQQVTNISDKDKPNFDTTEQDVFKLSATQNTKHSISHIAISLGLIVVSLAAIFIWTSIDNQQNTLTMVTQESKNLPQIIVLPLTNKTQDKKLAWLELGLRQLFVSQLDGHGVTVAPLSRTMDTLAQQVQEDKELSHTQILDIMATLDVNYLLKADISKVDNEFSINYRLFNKDGSIDGKSIFSNDILSSIPIISEQLNTALNITTEKVKSKLLSVNNEANIDYAKGIHALNKQGPLLAKRYFEAALIRDDSFEYAKAYLAVTDDLLGHWRQSEQRWQLILTEAEKQQDPQLKAWALIGIASIVMHQGDSQQALNILKNTEELKPLLMPVVKTAINQLIHRAYLHLAQDEQAFDVLNKTPVQDATSFQQRAQQLFNLASVPPLNSDKKSLLKAKQQSSAKAYYSRLGGAIYPLLTFSTTEYPNSTQLEKALSYYQLIGHLQGQAKTLLTLSYFYKLQPEKAWQLLNQALTLYKKLAIPIEQINVLWEMSETAMRLQQPELAIKLAIRVRDQAKELGALPYDAYMEHRLAFFHLEIAEKNTQQNLLLAFDYANLSLQSAVKLQGQQLIADSHFLLAVINTELGKKDNNNLLKSISFYQQRSDYLSLIVSQLYQAKQLMLNEDWQTAETLFIDLLNPLQKHADGLIYPEYFNALILLLSQDLAICQYQQKKFSLALNTVNTVLNEPLLTLPIFSQQQKRFKQSAETDTLQPLPLTHIPFHLLSKTLRRVNFP